MPNDVWDYLRGETLLSGDDARLSAGMSLSSEDRVELESQLKELEHQAARSASDLAVAERAVGYAEEGLRPVIRPPVPGTDVPLVVFEGPGDSVVTDGDLRMARGEPWMDKDPAVLSSRASQDYAWLRADLEQENVNRALKRQEELLTGNTFNAEMRKDGDAVYWNLAQKLFPEILDGADVLDFRHEVRQIVETGQLDNTSLDLPPGELPHDLLKRMQEFVAISDKFYEEWRESSDLAAYLRGNSEGSATDAVEVLGRDAYLMEAGGDPLLSSLPTE